MLPTRRRRAAECVMHVDEANEFGLNASFLGEFTQGCRTRRLARLYVTAGQAPDAAARSFSRVRRAARCRPGTRLCSLPRGAIQV